MKNWWRAFAADFRYSIASSRLRTIKFIVICLIPFLYGFFCVWAYWSPIANINEIPMAVVNYDQKACYKMHAAIAEGDFSSVTDAKPIFDFDYRSDIKTQADFDKDPSLKAAGYVFESLSDDLFTRMMNPSTGVIHVEKPGTELNINAKYLYGADKTNFTPKDKYWTQIKVPKGYTGDLLRMLEGVMLVMQNSPLNHKEALDPAALIAGKTLVNTETKLLLGKQIVLDDVSPVKKNASALQIYNKYGGLFETTADVASEHNLKFWSTYKFNFLSGQFMYVFNEFKFSLLNSLVPNIISKGISNQVLELLTSVDFFKASADEIKQAGLDNKTVWFSKNSTDSHALTMRMIASGVNQKLDDAFSKSAAYPVVKELEYKITQLFADDGKGSYQFAKTLFADGQVISYADANNPEKVKTDYVLTKDQMYNVLDKLIVKYVPSLGGDEFIHDRIDGIDRGEYGVGLGEFFLCIALWIGVLMQTFIYDRKRRIPGIKNCAHYFSKLALMVMTSWIQCAVLILTLLIIGFTELGPSFGLYLVWMLFTMTIFTVIIHAIWFLPGDGDVGKFIGVIYMILNLASGWGTFAPFMQGAFFQGISYIMPFSYAIHGQGTIIYGIGVLGDHSFFEQQIFEWFGILLLFAFVFIVVGYFATTLRTFYERYQSFDKVKLYGVLADMKHTSALMNAQLIQKNNKPYVRGKIDLSKLNLAEEVMFRNRMIKLYPPKPSKRHSKQAKGGE